MILEYAVLGRGKPLVILHGLLGSSENWNGTGSRLGAFYTVYVPDARNHGRSPHTEEINFPSMAGDVLEFMDAAGLASCFLLGHSMGGKTAMEVALQAPDRVNRLIVADMGPARHEAHFSDVLSALDGYDISRLQNRAEAEKGLAEIIPDRNIRLFVLKNLKRRPQGSWFWQANIPALARHYGELCAGIEGGGRTFSGRSLFLKGERSGYLEDSEIPAVRELFPRAEIKIIPAAGHWLHIDNQDAFVDEVLSFCES